MFSIDFHWSQMVLFTSWIWVGQLNWERASHVSWPQEDIKDDWLTFIAMFRALGKFGFINKYYRHVYYEGNVSIRNKYFVTISSWHTFCKNDLFKLGNKAGLWQLFKGNWFLSVCQMTNNIVLRESFHLQVAPSTHTGESCEQPPPCISSHVFYILNFIYDWVQNGKNN